MLTLKLLLVPTFLLLVTLAGKRWGPAIAGWLAGLPVVAGPILFFLAIEHGIPFTARAATAALSAVLASVAFSLAYAHAAQRLPWQASMALGLVGWTATALCLSAYPLTQAMALLAALLALLTAPRCFPRSTAPVRARPLGAVELGLRMLAGAFLTVAVTLSAAYVGPGWSGLLAVFPVLGTVLAVFSHRSQGPAFTATLLKAMVTGQYAAVAFCFTLSVALPRLPMAWAFGTAVMAAITVQISSKRALMRQP
ncbi:hypothetical protein SAMN05216303_10249 [Rhodoferax sp. OV413]|uniref:hypothetical protein n=1 Tax=Rhodoferax sp. OV413 TaxID=1855285 RepID=UPI000883A91F|nr:hypothetical protein [Rhodoferax sp. OV413]SDO66751.1 hypothetical protein SAMN05216303_10249 [Rhodoferax sp. OV413]